MKQNPTLGKENCPVYLTNSYDSLQSEQFIENPQRVDVSPWGVSSADQLAGDAPEIDDTGNRTCSDSVDIDSSLSVGSQSSFCLETDNLRTRKLLLYFKQSLNVKRRTDIEVSNIETLRTEVSLPNSKPFLICTVYRPPSAYSDWTNLFEEELSIAQTTGLEFILMGDYNIDITLSTNSKWMN